MLRSSKTCSDHFLVSPDPEHQKRRRPTRQEQRTAGLHGFFSPMSPWERSLFPWSRFSLMFTTGTTGDTWMAVKPGRYLRHARLSDSAGDDDDGDVAVKSAFDLWTKRQIEQKTPLSNLRWNKAKHDKMTSTFRKQQQQQRRHPTHLLWVMWLLTRWPAARAAMRDSSPASTEAQSTRASRRAFSPGWLRLLPWTPSICTASGHAETSSHNNVTYVTLPCFYRNRKLPYPAARGTGSYLTLLLRNRKLPYLAATGKLPYPASTGTESYRTLLLQEQGVTLRCC